MIWPLQTKRDLARDRRYLKSQLCAMELECNALRKDLAMWQELSRCANPRQHIRLAQDLHLAQAELQVLRGEDPHTASLDERGDVDWWLTAFVAGLLVFVAWLLVTVTGEISDTTAVRAQAFVVPVQAEETTTTSTTTAAPTSTTTASVPRKSEAPPRVTYDPGTIEAQILEAFSQFGADIAAQAVDVADCESVGLNPNAEGAEGERGLFQIHPKYHQERIRRLRFTWDQMYEVGPNIAVAADLFAEKGWQPWTCKP